MDADEIHREPDAEDGGDYTAYAGAEEDDEQFGDDLPEHSGGPLSDEVDGQHETLSDIHATLSTEIGGKEASEAETESVSASHTTTTDSM